MLMPKAIYILVYGCSSSRAALADKAVSCIENKGEQSILSLCCAT